MKDQVTNGFIRVHVDPEERVVISKCDNQLDDEDDRIVNIAWVVYSKDGLVEKYKKEFEVDKNIKDIYIENIKSEKLAIDDKITKLENLQKRINMQDP